MAILTSSTLGRSMPNDAPNHMYYRALEGEWRGRVQFEITDVKRLSSSCLRLRDRWSIWAMAMVSRRTASLFMSTSLDYGSRGHLNEVLHTTRTSCLGIPVYCSRETIHLNDDGRSFRLVGVEAYFPRLWKRREWTALGEVSADHRGALYQIPFFGEVMEQHTRVTPEGVEVVQITPFSLATILLQLQGDERNRSE